MMTWGEECELMAQNSAEAVRTSSRSENHPFLPLNLLAVCVGDGGR